MPGYGTGEALIKTLVATATGFTATGAVTQGNWRVLNKGLSASVAILHTRPVSRVFETHNTVREEWETIVEVWQKYVDDGTTYTSLTTSVTNILDKIDLKPHLGDTTGYVEESNAHLEEAQEQWRNRGNGPAWLSQNIVINWIGRQSRTFTD